MHYDGEFRINFDVNFLGELAQKLGFEEKLLLGGFKIFCFGGGSVIIEGHKGILLFSSQEMSFKVRGGTVSVLGENLVLKSFCKQSVVVSGTIVKIEFGGKLARAQTPEPKTEPPKA